MAGKDQLATFCMIVSAWAVPLLAFFGVLCFQESRMIKLPKGHHEQAAWGCLGSSAVYLMAFLGAFRWKRQHPPEGARPCMQEMTAVAERAR
mmetsp:Transcript_51133/g.144017  ORF Transcript_51133/g.144017 Transcript_51133/m.144017 type:complete len:92 (-) Transcript_51133:166-441(-)|eukprot:CAMPEP_0179300758 /NCGR_PEP_ID=MMETSP0797-20121207/47204_1 /TAXON_ID=47934 /ORGANISM="Dinophysis acuminata, Strain DAEP01" /LENGTH=91 /DNA_ID=CAMNT_0021010247 /DNA_START=113 /DNA_END=388 /DNA_ORIENTATION=-